MKVERERGEEEEGEREIGREKGYREREGGAWQGITLNSQSQPLVALCFKQTEPHAYCVP